LRRKAPAHGAVDGRAVEVADKREGTLCAGKIVDDKAVAPVPDDLRQRAATAAYDRCSDSKRFDRCQSERFGSAAEHH